ncbi:MAG: Flp pilus assembly protein CpaB [Anaerolineae bacterium]|nr:Flp pilus assembly protein CpaB [Anaerolineae bacterium]
MNRRVLILLLLVLVVVLVGAVVVLPGLMNPPAPAPDGATPVPGGGGQQVSDATAVPTLELVQVVVAVQEIPRGMAIPADAVTLRPWPRQSVTPDNLTNVADAVGRIARTDIANGQPLVSNLIIRDIKDVSSNIAKTGSDAALVIPPGLRAIAVPMDRLTGIGYAVQDGDYVDVIISFLFVDVDPNFQSIKPNKISILTVSQDGSIQFSSPIQGELQPSNFTTGPVLVIPNETQRPRLVTQTTVQAAYVVHVGNFPLDGTSFLARQATPLPTPTEEPGQPTRAAPPASPTPPVPDLITLAVSPQDAVVLTWAIESRIPITLTLRNARDTAPNPTTSVTLQYMIENFNVTQPPSLPYALEPALRSIRQQLIGNIVSLTSAVNAAGQPAGK